MFYSSNPPEINPFNRSDPQLIHLTNLPEIYLITDTAPPEDFFLRFQRILDSGARLIQLRLPGLNPTEYCAYAHPALELCREFDAQLMLNCAPDLALYLGGGIHLSAARLAALTTRPSLPWVSASCHNPQEINQARALGVDFAVLSPVLATSSHPEAQPLGWKCFSEWVNNAEIPIYALGGMTLGDCTLARSYGAKGIALLSAIWNSPLTSEKILRACV